MPFKLTHIMGCSHNFKGISDPHEVQMHIIKHQPSLSLLLNLIENVGGDSQWHRRKSYHNDNYLSDLKERIEKTSSHLWLFKNGKETVGFCQDFKKIGLSREFDIASGATAEIYKLGLFPEYCGRGYGGFYVSSVLAELFKENNVVYLNTRDSNKVNSVPFYERLGMAVVGEEKKAGDLIDNVYSY